MTKRQFLSFSAIGLTTLSSNISFAQQVQAAPELRVPQWIDGEGNKRDPFLLNSAENKGKWVFLKCFQSWCPGCHSRGFPTLKKLVDEFGVDHPNIAFAAIQTTFEGHSTNTIDELRPMQERYDTYIPYGHDEGISSLPRSNPKHFPNTMFDYRTRGTPWLILISPERQVVFADHHVNDDALIKELKRQFSLMNG